MHAGTTASRRWSEICRYIDSKRRAFARVGKRHVVEPSYSITKSFWPRCIAVMRFVNNGSRNWTRRHTVRLLLRCRRRRPPASQMHLRDWTRLLLRLNRKLKVSAASSKLLSPTRDRRRLWLCERSYPYLFHISSMLNLRCYQRGPPRRYTTAIDFRNWKVATGSRLHSQES